MTVFLSTDATGNNESVDDISKMLDYGYGFANQKCNVYDKLQVSKKLVCYARFACTFMFLKSGDKR